MVDAQTLVLVDPALVLTLPWSPGLLLSPLVFICTLLTVQNMGGYMSEAIIGYFQTVIHRLEIKREARKSFLSAV